MSDRVWEELSRTLRASAPWRRLREGSIGEEPKTAVRLPVPAAAWALDLLGADLGRPLLVVVPHESDALAWSEAAALFGRGALAFPAPSLTPYQETEVSLAVRAEESAALAGILRGEAAAVVATPRALFRRLPPPAAFESEVIRLAAGAAHSMEELAKLLVARGYHRADLVSEVGEFAVRGGVFDLFPAGLERPARLDFFGDTVESIRSFDVESQRSLAPSGDLASLAILPLALFPAGAEEARRLAALLSRLTGEEAGFESFQRLEELGRGEGFPGWENYLPLLAADGGEETVSLPDLMDDPLIVALDPPALEREIEHHAERLLTDFEARRSHRRLAVPPELLEHPVERVREALAGAGVTVGALAASGAGPIVAAGAGAIDFRGAPTDLFHGQIPRFPREVETARARGERLLLVAPAEHHSRLEETLSGYGVPRGRSGVELVSGELERGFRLPPAGAAVFGEPQLLPRLAPARPRRRAGAARYGPFVSGLRDLKVGDYVVHEDHGIGQFTSLRTIGDDGSGRLDPLSGLPPALRRAAPEGGEAEVEVMEITYAGGRTLLVPLSGLDQIQRYGGIEGISPRLDDLGGTSWNRTRERVRKGMRKLAGDLLKLYAERQLSRAPAFPADSDLQAQFEAAFDYEETADQLEAAAAIKADLEQERPMDRLLCGDVGFGKTEVAMRAAFKAVDAGYQVAVLAPTTILADQHLETFRARFASFPVTIEMISRFRSPAEVRDVRERLEAGKVDILIGTHRLLSRDVAIPRLGLLIVDEEQRFGVAQKERLKELKKNVHVLAMSATPVPRTLQLSLAGVRDLSVIETPPKDRMAVETAVLPWSAEVVREAIEFELERQGQVYYVFNRVEGIERIGRELRELVPGLRIAIGHGQMDEQELARRMHAFKAGEDDLLLATTIIENGIDISNVNTMIVHRADAFGLAQLYQLRGRVGRASQLAYCYLLYAPDRAMSQEARQRLAALHEFSELGSGFRVAARDLEIRGAGNLLGAEQSGHIAALGIETYLKMLEDAVKELQGEAPEEAPAVAIDLPVALAIPRDYVGDANLRMEIYRKLAAGGAAEEELLAELRDRFGPPPETVRELLAVGSLKRLAESARVQSISSRGSRLQIRLRKDTRIDVERLIRFVSDRPGASFSPTGVLTLEGISRARFVDAARETLEALVA